LQSKEQERKPLTYSGARPISIPIGGNAEHEASTAVAWGVGVSHEMIELRERRLSS